MANKEQLENIMRGVENWNRWRRKNPKVKIDLSDAILWGADLEEINLKGANLNGANLKNANLFAANLESADLRNCYLYGTFLCGADLSKVDISNTSIASVDLSSANFSKANLRNAEILFSDLTDSNLTETDLREAEFELVNFSNSIFSKTNFTSARFANMVFGDNDLSEIIGLKTISHADASTIGTDTIRKSKGKIPVEFLRGCGLSDLDIEYAKLANPDLSNKEISEITQNIFDLKATRPIQFSPLFISYSHENSDFVDKLETKLNKKGVRFWRDIHDATSGRLETQIDRAIRHNPTVLLILSEHSTSSDWVEHEARLARNLEKDLERDVLCPIALDDSWKTCNWPERIKEQIMEYNILDFSIWEDDDDLDVMFKRLINGLDMFYKK